MLLRRFSARPVCFARPLPTLLSRFLLAPCIATALTSALSAQVVPGETQTPAPAQITQAKPQAEGKGNSSEGGRIQPPSTQPQPDGPFEGITFRQIGPFRGGRVGAVTGVQSQPMTFYFGATGGGIFKTTDGGIHWAPVADKQLKLGSVGAIAVSDSDPNIVYAGTGEADLRGNASHGDGVYKSTDGGHTWKNVGLIETQQIGAVKIDPGNPDIVYVAALGHMAGPNPERGVFRTRNGGRTWKKVLFKSDRAGAIDLAIDPLNAEVIYASLYQFDRKPWTFASGGADSGLWKSTDGGDTWTDLSRNPGMPKGILGRIGIAVSPVRSGSMWAIVEAEEGGVFHSDDAGATWGRVNDQREVKQRAWYYSRIFADPKNENVLYALNTSFYKSLDGGHTFKPITTGHGDNHDLWIAKDDPNRMIESNDGGANVSFDGGKLFHTLEPAHRPVLSRSARQRLPIPPLRLAAGQHHR